MAKNDLDQYIADRTKKTPRFPDMVEAAEERRAIARELAAARKKLGTLSEYHQ